MLANVWISLNTSWLLATGKQLGTAITILASGPLAGWRWAGGWQSIFYVTGGVGVLWYMFWLFLIYDTPAQHPRISARERLYIDTYFKPHAVPADSVSSKRRSPTAMACARSSAHCHRFWVISPHFSFLIIQDQSLVYIKSPVPNMVPGLRFIALGRQFYYHSTCPHFSLPILNHQSLGYIKSSVSNVPGLRSIPFGRYSQPLTHQPSITHQSLAFTRCPNMLAPVSSHALNGYASASCAFINSFVMAV